MTDFTPEWIIVHALATTVHMEADARWVDRLHRQKGWLMNGYHEVITRPVGDTPAERQNHTGGFPTRPLDRPGAHVGGCGPEWNRKTIGISMAGGIDAHGNPEDNFHPDQKALLHEAVEEYRERFDIPLANVIGHRDLIKMTDAAPKACPCFDVREWLGGDLETAHFGSPLRPFKGDPLGVPVRHTVQPGETLSSISRLYGVPVVQLQGRNLITDPDTIRAGQVLKLR